MRSIYINIFLLLPLILFAQEERLRYEIIDVFKSYSPVVANSFKISTQPIFDDTLQEKIIPNKPILSRNLFIEESINFEYPSKFKFNQLNNYYASHASIELGSHTFFQTKFHYSNGLSMRHNSGVYLQISSEDYSLRSPYFKKHNGDLFRQVQFYTTRFLNDKILKTNFQINSLSGLYWGGLGNVNIDDINSYQGNNISLLASLLNNNFNSLFKLADVSFNYFSNNDIRTEIALSSSINLQITKSLKTYSFDFSGQLVSSNLNNPGLLISSPLFSNVMTYRSDSLGEMVVPDKLVSSQFILSGNNVVDYHAGFNISYGQLSHDNSSQFLLFPTLKLFKEIGDAQSVDFELIKRLKYNSIIDLFETIPYIDPYFKNFLSEELQAGISYRNLLTQYLSFFSTLNYNHFKGRVVPFLYDLYDVTRMNSVGMYLADCSGFDFVSSLSWRRSSYDVMLSLYLNSIKSNEHLDQSFFANKINAAIDIGVVNNLNIIADFYYTGNKDALRLPYSLDENMSYVVLPSYLSANLSLKYILKNMIFSLNLRNLFNQRYHAFDGYYDDDGFKLSINYSYRF